MEYIIIALLLVVLTELSLLVYLQTRRASRLQKRSTFIDTSVLIDGRIVDVAASGFMGEAIVIPRSVIGELQFLADNADHEKRSRARRGLDVVRELQQMDGLTVEILSDGSTAKEGVDERLLKLAKQYGGAICTIDYNLNKVAQVEEITVLNINELAQNLRMAYLPGEQTQIELTQKGQDGHQAVGHLPDGTMVVVEQAVKHIGKKVDIEFIRSLQTAAGRMMFARLVVIKPDTKAEKAHSSAQRKRQQGKQPSAQRKSTRAQTKRRTSTQSEASLVELANR